MPIDNFHTAVRYGVETARCQQSDSALSSTGMSLLLSFLHLDDLFVSCILHWLLSYDVNLLADSEQEEQV